MNEELNVEEIVEENEYEVEENDTIEEEVEEENDTIEEEVEEEKEFKRDDNIEKGTIFWRGADIKFSFNGNLKITPSPLVLFNESCLRVWNSQYSIPAKDKSHLRIQTDRIVTNSAVPRGLVCFLEGELDNENDFCFEVVGVKETSVTVKSVPISREDWENSVLEDITNVLKNPGDFGENLKDIKFLKRYSIEFSDDILSKYEFEIEGHENQNINSVSLKRAESIVNKKFSGKSNKLVRINGVKVKSENLRSTIIEIV